MFAPILAISKISERTRSVFERLVLLRISAFVCGKQDLEPESRSQAHKWETRNRAPHENLQKQSCIHVCVDIIGYHTRTECLLKESTPLINCFHPWKQCMQSVEMNRCDHYEQTRNQKHFVSWRLSQQQMVQNCNTPTCSLTGASGFWSNHIMHVRYWATLCK